MRISMKKTAAMSAAALCFAFAGTASGAAGTDASSTETPAAAMAQLKLESAWDKTFKKSDKVEHSKVMFRTRYGFTLAADMYIPKNAGGGSFPPLRSPGRSAPSRNSQQGFTRRPLPSRVSSPLRLIRLTPARAAESRVSRHLLTSTPRTSWRLSISSRTMSALILSV